MKRLLFLAVLFTVFLTVQAHTFLSNLTINGTRLELGKCIRPYEDNRNFPVKDLKSKELTCRTTSMNVADTDICGVAAGSKMSVEWHESDEKDRAISSSHLGPCIVYLSPLDANGDGDVWFKIFEDGYDPETKKWCVDKIIASKGLMDITIPADLKAGNYLMRTEVIALHEADREYGTDENAGAELFPNCAQLYIGGAGSAQPAGVAIPGAYTTKDPGLLFDLYDGYDSYPIPGPPLYKPGSVSAGSSSTGNSSADSSADEEKDSSADEDTTENVDEDKTNNAEEDNTDSSEIEEDTNTSKGNAQKANVDEEKTEENNSDQDTTSEDDSTSAKEVPVFNLNKSISQEIVAGSTSKTEDVAIGATITNAAGQPCVRVRRKRRRDLRGEL